MEGSEKEAVIQAETAGDERIKAIFLLFWAPISSVRRSNQPLCNRLSAVIVSETRRFGISGAIRQGGKLPERKRNVLGNWDELAAAGTQKGVPANPPLCHSPGFKPHWGRGVLPVRSASPPGAPVSPHQTRRALKLRFSEGPRSRLRRTHFIKV